MGFHDRSQKFQREYKQYLDWSLPISTDKFACTENLEYFICMINAVDNPEVKSNHYTQKNPKQVKLKRTGRWQAKSEPRPLITLGMLSFLNMQAQNMQSQHFSMTTLLVTCLVKGKKAICHALYESTPVLNTTWGFYFNCFYNVEGIHFYLS